MVRNLRFDRRLVKVDRRRYSIWIEQCWRDVLSVAWDGMSVVDERVPITRIVQSCAPCCQQFIISRAKIHSRPLEVWKKLLNMIGKSIVVFRGVYIYIFIAQLLIKSATRAALTLTSLVPSTAVIKWWVQRREPMLAAASTPTAS